MASNDLAARITALEDETWKVMQSEGSRLLPYLSPDCQLLFPMGLKVTHKSNPSLHEVLTSDAFVPWKSYRMKDVNVISVGATGAVITYTVSAVRPALGPDGQEETFRALISSTWKMEEVAGDWLLCVHQQTPFNRSIEEDVALAL